MTTIQTIKDDVAKIPLWTKIIGILAVISGIGYTVKKRSDIRYGTLSRIPKYYKTAYGDRPLDSDEIEFEKRMRDPRNFE